MSEFDAFSRNYNEILDDCVKAAGENTGYFARYKAVYLARLLGKNYEGRFLDYGCGIGNISQYLKELCPHIRVDGFDPSLESLKAIPPALKNQGTFTHRSEELRRDYDVVFMANVLHHVDPPKRESFLASVRELLTSHGRLVVIEHNPINPGARWVVRTCEFDKGVVMVKKGDLIRTLRGVGYDLEKIDNIVFFPHFLSWLRPLEPALAWCPFGAQYSTIAKKKEKA